MTTRQTFLSSLVILLVLGGAVLCALRWQAWFGMPEEPLWQGSKTAYTFHCFGDDSLPGFVQDEQGYWQDTLLPDTLEILLLGDVHSLLTHADYDTLASRVPHADCYAQLGDWLERGYEYYAQQLAFALKGTRLDSIPVISCPGNHEYHKGLRRPLSPLWDEMFCHPKNGFAGFENTTYYVDFKGLRFIAIDTEGLRWLHDYTRLNTWLTGVIRQASDRFVVVIMHHPVYSASRGRFNPGVYLSCVAPLREADLVIAGHDHQYARQLPFVEMTSTTTEHTPRFRHYHERQGVTSVYYQQLSLWGDTLRMRTYRLADGELYDECFLTR